MNTVLEAVHGPYFTQKLAVGADLRFVPRAAFLRGLCAGKRVLHVGCVDHPITDVANNLHLALDEVCARLDGVDTAVDGLELLAPHVRNGDLFSSLDAVEDRSYDLVLVPEVIEHVGNVEGFLAELDRVDFTEIIITAPDAYQCARLHFDYDEPASTFVEFVHPDHNCWYTPFTLSNTVRKYTPWDVQGVFFFNRISLLLLANRRPADLGLKTLTG